MTGPFGEALPNQANPTNTTPGTTYHYVGQHQKMTDLESSAIMGGITQMGARVYLPILGRFLQVDPVEGGADNNYVYANDPVNEFDLDGRWIRKAWNSTKKAVKSAAKWVSRHQEGIKNGLIAVSVGACVVATAGVCGAVAVATAIGSGAVSGVSSYVQHRNFGRAVFVGAASAAVGYIGLKKIAFLGRFGKGMPKAVRWFGRSRNYRSFATAIRKAPARKRFTGIILWGARRYAVQQGSSYVINRIQNRYRR